MCPFVDSEKVILYIVHCCPLYEFGMWVFFAFRFGGVCFSPVNLLFMLTSSKVPSNGSSGLRTLFVPCGSYLSNLLQQTGSNSGPAGPTQPTNKRATFLLVSQAPLIQHSILGYSHFFWCFVLVLIPGNILLLLLPAKSNLAICAQLLIPTAGACLKGDFFQTLPSSTSTPKAAPYLYFCSTSGRGFYFQTLPLPTSPPPKVAPCLYSST